MTPTVQSGARWSGAAAGSRLGGGAAGAGGGGGVSAVRSTTPLASRAARTRPPRVTISATLTVRAARSTFPPRTSSAARRKKSSRAPGRRKARSARPTNASATRSFVRSPVLIEFVARAEAQRPRADVERDQLVVIGREPLRLDTFERHLAAGRERRRGAASPAGERVPPGTARNPTAIFAAAPRAFDNPWTLTSMSRTSAANAGSTDSSRKWMAAFSSVNASTVNWAPASAGAALRPRAAGGDGASVRPVPVCGARDALRARRDRATRCSRLTLPSRSRRRGPRAPRAAPSRRGTAARSDPSRRRAPPASRASASGFGPVLWRSLHVQLRRAPRRP